MKQIYIKCVELSLNPFFDKTEFSKKDSEQNKKFVDQIFAILSKNQMI